VLSLLRYSMKEAVASAEGAELSLYVIGGQ